MAQEFKYPWQQAVADAFMAPRDSLLVKVNVAERAISARLTSPDPTDREERIALKDALRALRVLIREVEPAPREKEDIA